jgi:hypothetical protein
MRGRQVERIGRRNASEQGARRVRLDVRSDHLAPGPELFAGLTRRSAAVIFIQMGE